MTPAGARPAVLFDADGTLTDSDYLHVHAWYRAFSEARVDVLARDDLVSAVTSSQDVDTATPQPDTVQVALERARVDARDAVFIGDAVWDVEACERAGAPTIAVLSGGVSRGEFETAVRNSRCASGFRERKRFVCAPSRHRDRTACEGGPDRLIIPAVARTASRPATARTGCASTRVLGPAGRKVQGPSRARRDRRPLGA